ncbi:MAG: cell division protein ZipA [Thiohalomonadales bacterium]|nr:cell division protein ZipA [Thiohalomonadales bacterium]
MDTLRLILLIIGTLLIGAMLLYYWITSEKKPRFPSMFAWLKFSHSSDGDEMQYEISTASPSQSYDDEPDSEDIATLSELSLPVTEPEVDIDALGPMSALTDDPGTPGEMFVVALNVMAREGERFQGVTIHEVLQELGFVFGDMNLFHSYSDKATPGIPVCSLANTIEPGTFDLEHMAEMETPGLLLFMQLPGPLNGKDAFDRLLELGRALAEQLDGVLCDESRSVLTLQTISHIKEKIDAFYFKQKMSSQNQRHH